MRFRLDMCDVDLQLKIKNWVKPEPGDIESDHWTQDEFSLKGKYIDYSFDTEALMSGEVVYLRNALGALLAGRIEEAREVEFAEPDFIFRLSPAVRRYSVPGKVWYKNGYVDLDIEMEMVIQFWCNDGALGTNQFSMTFDRSEIDALYSYLLLVTGEIGETDERITKLVSAGIILPE